MINLNEYKSLFKNKSFTKLWSASFLSMLGDYVFSISLYIWVYNSTGSVVALSSSIFFQFLPRLIMSPIAGIVVDRFDRKKILIFSDLLRAFILSGLFFMQTADKIILVYLIILLNAAITMIARPAKSAIVPLVIEKELLIKYNSFKELTESIILILGPAIGGILAITGFDFVITVDIISFIISAILIATITLSKSVQNQEKIKSKTFCYSKEVNYVSNLFKNNRVFTGIATVTIFVSLAQGGINVLFLPFLLEVVKASEVQFGIVLAFQGVGSVIGSLVAGVFTNYSKANWIIGGGVLFSGIALLVYTTFPVLNVVLLVALLEGISIMGVFIFIPSLVQTYFQEENLGKVFGFLDSFESGSLLISMGVSGMLTGIWGIRPTFYLLALLYLTAGIIGIYMLKEQRINSI